MTYKSSNIKTKNNQTYPYWRLHWLPSRKLVKHADVAKRATVGPDMEVYL